MEKNTWHIPPSELALNSNEVHVWRIALNAPQETIERLWQYLAPDERARAERFRFVRDRNQLIIGRGVLRVLLGCYLTCEPQQIRFRYTSYGKPSLDGVHVDAGLQFNLSHSHQLALLAFTYSREIGIDIEYMRPDIEFEQLGEHFFSRAECAVLMDVPPDLRAETFYNCWTRKEAYIKARGEGLSMPLDQFDVSLRPGEPAALLRSRSQKYPAEVERWSLRALEPGEKYAAALAVEGADWQLRCWDWQGE